MSEPSKQQQSEYKRRQPRNMQRKRTFSSIFASHVYGAAKQMNSPLQLDGFAFFHAEAISVDAKDPTRTSRYTMPRLGRVVILTEEQKQFIMEYLGIESTTLEEPEKKEE